MRAPIFVALSLSLWSADALADQLACNSLHTAKRAASKLNSGALMIDFCSQCDDRVKVIRVRSAFPVKDCNYEVEVVGDELFRSTRRFRRGRGVRGARFRKGFSQYRRQVDLAYVYVETSPNRFRWLGGQLGLSAKVPVRTLSLPMSVYRQISNRRPPKPAARLAEFYPCLEIDTRKAHPEHLKCVERVRGTIARGSQVHAWTRWKGKRSKVAMVRFVPLASPKKKLVRALRYDRGRGVATAALSTPGQWALELVENGRVKARATVEIR